MLQNEPLVAKIGVDTAENEPIFGWIQLVQLSRFNSSILSLREPHPHEHEGALGRVEARQPARAPRELGRGRRRQVVHRDADELREPARDNAL